jgi:hypothetical protein
MSTDTLKQAICDALATWIRQRPGFGQENTSSGDRREVARDKRDAELLLQAVQRHDSITGEKLIEASKRAFGGRLEFKVEKFWLHENGAKTMQSGAVTIDYTIGQYWPTEYRAAAAAVLAAALWEHMRDNMPSGPNRDGDRYWDTSLAGGKGDFTNAGDWLRRSFRKEFGSALQRRWFN